MMLGGTKEASGEGKRTRCGLLGMGFEPEQGMAIDDLSSIRSAITSSGREGKAVGTEHMVAPL